MQLPLPNQFASYTELLEFVQAFAKTQRYAITIRRSRLNKRDKIKNMTLGCDRSGVYRNRLNLTDDTCHRETASRLINCPFELSEPFVRRLNAKQKKIVKQMDAAGSYPREILLTIYQNDQSSMAISKTVILISVPQNCITSGIPSKRNLCSNFISAYKDTHVHQSFLFEPLLYHVSVFALNKIYDELIKALNATPDSSLKPCTEELVDTPPIVLENSVTKKPRGRPVGAENKNKRTTQKDLSAFEHVEKQSRQCGTCHQPGYNS
ncbi:hypothetical protein C2G38_2196893 [Gigaspora rosea]|uniref:Uncharacterized protein n=1 Tax=Gigaspora rosea TaxID=44941 RepID=A0A397UUI2_9GLOM|nr:hypothetical protein C2G38_2196893 [Gigaspora rosea]